MKRILTILIISLFAFSLVSACGSASCNIKNYNIKVITKNPTDWAEVKDKATGSIALTQGKFGSAIIKHAKPFTDYTLIYYGNTEYNDVWNYATCISSGKTNKNGNARILRGLFDYSSFTNDGIVQKFWIVTSSDVNCDSGAISDTMIAWNPSEYLFEKKTI